MKQFLITMGGVLAGLVLFFVIAPIVIIVMIASAIGDKPSNPGEMVLTLDLREEMSDQPSQNPFAALSGAQSLLDTLRKIEAAGDDDAVKGIYIRANTDGMAASQAEELRAALEAFRQKGKFVIAHIQADGVRMSMAGYTAVAGADELWLQNASEFQPMGLSSEVSFFADTLRRFHIEAQFEQREEYKNAPNQFTQSGFTPAHREATQSLMNGLYGDMITDIAADREIAPAQARAAVEATPMTGDRAVAAKLADKLGRPEDAEAAALERAGGDAELVDIAQYVVHPHLSGPIIAVVSGEGAIVSGPNRSSPFSDAASMNSDAVAQALLDASEDNDVKAIIFRVSSPGGSVVASDQILHAVRTAQGRGKKVIVSMGEVAASGGYYVAAHADEIVASSTTITGSIGVFGGKIVLGPALEHYASIRNASVSVGSPLATMFSADAGFTQAERAAFAGFIDRAYNDFLSLVADGRHLTVAQAREVARGRVWTGDQAKARGLVDHIGGFSVALQRAKALAGIGADERVQLRMYPTPRSPFEQFQNLFGASAENAQSLAALAEIARDPQLVEALAQLRANREASARAEAQGVRVR
ncbi:MAG: signal peptide peptidase SppA [Caulobacterales bacterium]